MTDSPARTGFSPEDWFVEQEALVKLSVKSKVHCQVFSKSSSRSLLMFACWDPLHKVFLIIDQDVKHCC